MRYIHISLYVGNGMVFRPGETYNIGRNAAKRAARAGKPRKKWQAIPRGES